MSTRGAVIFRIDGKDKTIYNHSDSYPSWLGREVALFVRDMVGDLPTEERAREKFVGIHPTTYEAKYATLQRPRIPEDRAKVLVRELRDIDDDTPPTPEEIEEIQTRWQTLGYSHPLHQEVSKGDDWYAHLRGAQGDLPAILTIGVYTEAGPGWLADSLYCEWAYCLNFDERKVEVYQGSQRKAHTRGRYADLPFEAPEHRKGQLREYWPVSLIAEFSFDDPELISKIKGVDRESEEEDEEGS